MRRETGPHEDLAVPQHRMLINYVPGDECRVAITRDGLLEELYAERLNAVGHVGNIYVGRVVNVEASIQAAFIDFGLEQNGFLHITDLHPRYFPGEEEDATESVGKKTPRRDRPPIQRALKRGQEIIVQVIKEGIGTKGPTLTSYLSIPGRFLVMMPDMERVGVSRKVEDDELRREARRLLDDVELPKGFGFILRTAGIGKSKTEIKRDLAYLQRLWKDMENRRKGGKKPRLLYTESDLLVRSLRDVLTAEIDEIVVDDDHAIARASRFLKIVAPRSSTKLLHYDGPAPMFHAFGIEEQIQAIHKREAPLPSGGRLVIDETEALVAIDVNSGKMRASNDAETSAFRTNMEAADEICRQIRLRDLGGLLVLDLIDMRSRNNRRDVENKFKALFKRDRARTKLLPISQLGLLELTRQRMRGSLRSAHFGECRTCAGTGMVQRPESVASDALRDLKRVLLHDQVRRVDMVVPARVAGELLSSKRAMLARIERETEKGVDVRVSETLAADKVVFYAYDSRGADVDIDRLPTAKTPKGLKEWDDGGKTPEQWAVDPGEEAAEIAAEEAERQEKMEAEEAAGVGQEEGQAAIDVDHEPEDEGAGGKKKRRRRRRRRKGDRKGGEEADAAPGRDAGEPEAEQKAEQRAEASSDGSAAGKDAEASSDGESGDGEGGGKKRRRRRRRRRGGRGRGRGSKSEENAPSDNGRAEDAEEPTSNDEGQRAEPAPAPEAKSEASDERDDKPAQKKKRSRRGGRKKAAAKAESADEAAIDDGGAESGSEAEAKPATKKRTRKKSTKKKTTKKTAKKATTKKKTTRKKTTRKKKTEAKAADEAPASDDD